MELNKIFRDRLTPGMALHTPTDVPFILERIIDSSVTVKVGRTEHQIELPMKAFDEVLQYLSHREWVSIGAIHDIPKEGTIDEIVQRHTLHRESAASYLVPILVAAGTIELEPKRPGRARILR